MRREKKVTGRRRRWGRTRRGKGRSEGDDEEQSILHMVEENRVERRRRTDEERERKE